MRAASQSVSQSFDRTLFKEFLQYSVIVINDDDAVNICFAYWIGVTSALLPSSPQFNTALSVSPIRVVSANGGTSNNADDDDDDA